MATYTIGLIYDTHVTDNRKTYDGVPTTEAAIDKLNSVGVDWTVHGGDLRPLASTSATAMDWGGWDGADNPYYESDFAVIKDLMENRLNSDYYVVRGNHDRPVTVCQDYFPSEEYSPSDDHGNTETYWGVEDEADARFVYLDSCPLPGYHVADQGQNFVSSPQLSMVERLMDADPSKPTFVFVHAPLKSVEGSGGKVDTYDTCLNYPSVREALERGTVPIVHSGHLYTQRRDEITVNGIQYTYAEHLVDSTDSTAEGDVRWLEVDTTANTAQVNYYNIETATEGSFTQVSW